MIFLFYFVSTSKSATFARFLWRGDSIELDSGDELRVKSNVKLEDFRKFPTVGDGEVGRLLCVIFRVFPYNSEKRAGGNLKSDFSRGINSSSELIEEISSSIPMIFIR